MLRGFLMALALLKGSIQDCSSSNSIATITSMGINPESPKPGDNSTIWVAYDLSKDVTGGTVQYSYKLNYIPITPTVVNLCDQEECPIPAGCYNASGSSTFPDVSGRIEGKIEWFNENDEPIWCVNTIYMA